MIDYNIKKSSVVKRINRQLANKNQVLRKSRGWQIKTNFGEYYIHSRITNSPVKTHISLEAFARGMEVLRPEEEIIEG